MVLIFEKIMGILTHNDVFAPLKSCR